MNIRSIPITPALCLLLLTATQRADADQAKILAADFYQSSGSLWTVDVTLRHADSGWDHYADQWRVVDAEGHVLGKRVLLHPHVDEQPFTRGQSGVNIPPGVTTVFVEAHDQVHGWTPERLRVDLTLATDGRLRIESK